MSLLLPLALAWCAACGDEQQPAPTAPSVTIAPAPTAPIPPALSTGRIAFVSDRDGSDAIYVANPDGSDVIRLTRGQEPAWAPDGRQLAFERGGVIFTINADGTHERRVTAGIQPAWSPDGGRLAIVGGAGFRTINVDGSDPRVVFDPSAWNTADGEYGAVWPSWSPDGSRIAFSGQPGAVRTAYVGDGQSGTTSVFGADGFDAEWTPSGELIFNRFTGPGTASNNLGSSMRIFTSFSTQPLIPEATAPARPDYWDQQATWSR